MPPTIPITHYHSSSKQQNNTEVLSYYSMLITDVYLLDDDKRTLLRIIPRPAHIRVRGVACALKHQASVILCLTSLVLCRTKPRRALSQP